MKHSYTNSFQRDGEATNNLGYANYYQNIRDHICEPTVVTQSSRTLGGDVQINTWTACSICGMPMGDALLKKINSEPTVQERDATTVDSSTESQKQLLIDIMDEDQKDGLYDDIKLWTEQEAKYYAELQFGDKAKLTTPKGIIEWENAEEDYNAGANAVLSKLMPEIERLKKALQQIEQMSDPGSHERAIADMKSIASNALNFKP